MCEVRIPQNPLRPLGSAQVLGWIDTGAWARLSTWGGGKQSWDHRCRHAVQVERHGARQVTRWGNYFRHNSNILNHAWACDIMCAARTKCLCLYMQSGKVFCSHLSVDCLGAESCWQAKTTTSTRRETRLSKTLLVVWFNCATGFPCAYGLDLKKIFSVQVEDRQ